jgi:hypothetical protein
MEAREPRPRSFEVARARWPRVARALEACWPSAVPPALSIDGIQLESRFDSSAEAHLQAELVPRDARSATVYGTGGGALPACLLERTELRRLRVVVLAPRATAVVLADSARCAWVADPRVEFVLAADESELQRPFAACAADLRLATADAARVRDLVLIELAQARHARGMRQRYLELEQRLEWNRALHETDGDVRELSNTRRGERIHVIAAGPSLCDGLELLRERVARELLIAVDGALPTLLAAGIYPPVVTAVEPDRDSLLRYFGGDLGALRAASLVYAPIVHADVLRAWPGRRLCFVPDLPRYTQTAGVPARGRLWCSGSVLHPSVDLAVRMGAAEVVLHGADFAFTRGRTHVVGNPIAASAPQRGPCAWVLDARGERVPSQPNLIAFLRDLEGYIARHPAVRFWNAGVEGAAIRGAPAWRARLAS